MQRAAARANRYCRRSAATALLRGPLTLLLPPGRLQLHHPHWRSRAGWHCAAVRPPAADCTADQRQGPPGPPARRPPQRRPALRQTQTAADQYRCEWGGVGWGGRLTAHATLQRICGATSMLSTTHAHTPADALVAHARRGARSRVGGRGRRGRPVGTQQPLHFLPRHLAVDLLSSRGYMDAEGWQWTPLWVGMSCAVCLLSGPRRLLDYHNTSAPP